MECMKPPHFGPHPEWGTGDTEMGKANLACKELPDWGGSVWGGARWKWTTQMLRTGRGAGQGQGRLSSVWVGDANEERNPKEREGGQEQRGKVKKQQPHQEGPGCLMQQKRR